MDFLLPFPLLLFLPSPGLHQLSPPVSSLGLSCEVESSPHFLLLEIGSTLLTLLPQQPALAAEAPDSFEIYQVHGHGLRFARVGLCPCLTHQSLLPQALTCLMILGRLLDIV